MSARVKAVPPVEADDAVLYYWPVGRNDVVTMAAAINAVKKALKGLISLDVANIDTHHAPQIRERSKIEMNGVLYRLAAVQTASGSCRDNAVNYVYAAQQGSGLAFSYSATAPEWDFMRNGWYSGDSRAILKFWYFASGPVFGSKIILEDCNSMRLQNRRYTPAAGGLLVLSGPVNRESSVELAPGYYRYEVRGGTGGSGGAGGTGDGDRWDSYGGGGSAGGSGAASYLVIGGSLVKAYGGSGGGGAGGDGRESSGNGGGGGGGGYGTAGTGERRNGYGGGGGHNFIGGAGGGYDTDSWVEEWTGYGGAGGSWGTVAHKGITAEIREVRAATGPAGRTALPIPAPVAAAPQDINLLMGLNIGEGLLARAAGTAATGTARHRAMPEYTGRDEVRVKGNPEESTAG